MEAAASPPVEPVELECRLCLATLRDEAEGLEAQLCFPCNCRAPVHHGCLLQWQRAQEQFLEQHSFDEAQARMNTCEVCGARLMLGEARPKPQLGAAVCRAQGGTGKVALRRIPTLSRATRNFSDFSAADGQKLDVLEQDATGEFFRVRAVRAARYRGEGITAVAEGWIRHVYLDWQCESTQTQSWLPPPRMPPAFPGEGAERVEALSAAETAPDSTLRDHDER
ncbi:Fmr1 [Symbiodinium natans]|uniref:Fmr1 protein n=1 Tax=Symbiodinium natans TaxID=878477 RepID=A0A812IGY5_9DINO|nr:Fmr1 [Symbiodinium natans]